MSRSPLPDSGGSLPSDRPAGCGAFTDGVMAAAGSASVFFIALIAYSCVEALVSGQARGAAHHGVLNGTLSHWEGRERLGARSDAANTRYVKEMKLRCKKRWPIQKQRHHINVQKMALFLSKYSNYLTCSNHANR